MRIFITILAALILASPAGRASELRIDASMCNFDADAGYGTNLHGQYTIGVSSHIGGHVSSAKNRGVTKEYLKRLAEQRLIKNGFVSVMGRDNWLPMEDFAHLWVDVSIISQSTTGSFFYNIEIELTRRLKCAGFARDFKIDVLVWGSTTFGIDDLKDMNQFVTTNVRRLVDEFSVAYLRSGQ